jgi:Domain of unknown function (DUF2804), C-terminal
MPNPAIAAAALPFRGTFGDHRPASVQALALPPRAMPSHVGLRPLKAWRYVGVYGPELMLCAANVRIGAARQAFWAVWDRRRGRLHERTVIGRGPVRLGRGRVDVSDRDVTIALALDEESGIETVCRSGAAYAWTRKQGGIRAHGVVRLDGRSIPLDARAVVDDTAGYYERHTRWRWSAGVGRADDGRTLAWNLVSGVNDPPSGSERTAWVDGVPRELSRSAFSGDLLRVDDLRFQPEAIRERRDNLLVIRSSYRQPFGTFAGELAGVALAEGYGVMEEHDAWW